MQSPFLTMVSTLLLDLIRCQRHLPAQAGTVEPAAQHLHLFDETRTQNLEGPMLCMLLEVNWLC